MKYKIFVVMVAMLVCGVLFCEEKTDSLKKKKESAYEKLFKAKHEKADGLLGIRKMADGKLYFEFPLNLLDREMLLSSIISQTSNNFVGVPGSKSYVPMFIAFTKVGEKIQIREINTDNYLNGLDNNVLSALGKNTIPTIFANYDIKAYNSDSTAVVFDVTSLFLGHKKELSPFSYLGMYGKANGLSESFKKDLSYLEEIKAFDDNVTIKSTLSYSYSMSNPSVKNMPFTAQMTRTLVLLDEEPYRPRIMDSRMSVFYTGKYNYNNTKQKVEAIFLANRWDLEPVDMDAWQKGEMVEVKKPITFYIDPGFPKSWQPAIIEGVTQWNELFEEIGFKNVISAELFPTDNPDFDPDNIKYSTIRYSPIPITNAMGPSWIDPRSGEIINASVYVFHDIIKMLNTMLFTQTAQVDERVQKVNIDDEVIANGLRYVVSHEVGHCLGFMHNMGASSVVPVDSLRSPSYTKKYGTTPSIMDYARFNYIAQPEDKDVSLCPPRFGRYDAYGLKWLYTPVPSAKTAEEEYEVTSKWITQAMANPIYRYGKQQFKANIDPRSQIEDLGDNSVKASEYGVKNLKYILANLNNWTAKDDLDLSFRKQMYMDIVNQYINYIGHVYTNIGGIYLYEKMEGDPVESFVCVDADTQKESLHFLLDQLYDLDWLNNKELLNKISILGSPADAVRQAIVGAVINAPSKATMSVSAKHSDNPYTARECFEDISDYIWNKKSKSKDLTSVDMEIQREYVKQLAKSAGLSKYVGSGSKTSFSAVSSEKLHSDILGGGTHTSLCSCSAHCASLESNISEISGFGAPDFSYYVGENQSIMYYNHIKEIAKLLKSRIKSSKGETKMHYEYLLYNINKALN